MSGVIAAERRSRCVVCGGASLARIAETPPIPVYQGCVDADASLDIARPMQWDGCEACGSAQLANPLPLDLVYQGGHATGLGGAWDLHHQAFAAFVARHKRGDVLEVGGGGGKLARLFRSRDAESHWYILEPNPTAGGEPIPRMTMVRGFFDENVVVPDKVETLVFCHCLEHIYNPAEIIATMAAKLSVGDRLIIAWPDLENWIVRGEPGAINWEHTFFVSLEVLLGLFRRHGFRLIEREAFGTDHSFFIALENAGERATPAFSGEGFASTQARIQDYFAKFSRKASALNAIARGETRPIFASPASIYTQYLFAFGLAPTLLGGLVDNSPLKQGRRLYGVPLRVLSAAAIAKQPSVIFLNGGAHNAEMAASFKKANPATETVFVNAIA